MRTEFLATDRRSVVYGSLATLITVAAKMAITRDTDPRSYVMDLFLLPGSLLLPLATQRLEQAGLTRYSYGDSVVFGAGAALLEALRVSTFKQAGIAALSATFAYEAAKSIGDEYFNTKHRVQKTFYLG